MSEKVSAEARSCSPQPSPGLKRVRTARTSSILSRSLEAYTVFNLEQIDGLPAAFHQPASPRDRLPSCVLRMLNASSRLRELQFNTRAHPPFTTHPATKSGCLRSHAFRDADSYYATLTHELIHWTRHPSRLNRSFDQKRFGDEGYAMEELVAELGSAFICADLGLTPEMHADNAGYISSWLNVLKRDKRAIFTAASHAQRAASYLNAFSTPIVAPDFEPLPIACSRCVSSGAGRPSYRADPEPRIVW